jgi:dGTPase
MIDYMVRDVLKYSAEAGKAFAKIEIARDAPEPTVNFSPGVLKEANTLSTYMLEQVYRHPIVARQNMKARVVLERLFEVSLNNPTILPKWIQSRLAGLDRCGIAREVAHYLASLSDRAALDLYAEIYESGARGMGHFLD